MFIILDIIYVFVFFFSHFNNKDFFVFAIEWKNMEKKEKYKKDIYYRFL